jgi:hypothetical protein
MTDIIPTFICKASGLLSPWQADYGLHVAVAVAVAAAIRETQERHNKAGFERGRSISFIHDICKSNCMLGSSPCFYFTFA